MSSAKEILRKERANIRKFSKLRNKVERYDFEPLADKITPLNQREARCIPRPGSSVQYVEGTQLAQVSEEEMAQLKEVFENFDEDGSGAIEMHELAAVFISLELDLDVDNLELIMRNYDEDESGSITLDEFVPMFLEAKEEVQKRVKGLHDRRGIKKGQVVYIRDAESGRCFECRVMDVIVEYEEQAVEIPGLPPPTAGSHEGQEGETRRGGLPVEKKVKKREYVVKIRGGQEGEGEEITTTRGGFYTEEEFKAPQSSVSIQEVLPASRDSHLPTFDELKALHVDAGRMKRFTAYAKREATAINEWQSFLKKYAYPTELLSMDSEEAAALRDGDWEKLHTSLCPRIKPLFESSGFAEAKAGLLPRLSTSTPSDYALSASSVLTKAKMDVTDAENDLNEFVMRFKRGEKLPAHLAERHGIGRTKIVDKSDVKRARERLVALETEFMALTKVVGRQRMGQYKKPYRNKKFDVMELEMERDRLMDEYTKYIAIEEERLSLTYQMHAGPQQTELLTKSKKQIKYLKSSLLDAKDIFAERIAAALGRDDEFEEGKVAMEMETEDIERLMLQTLTRLERLLVQEVSVREADVHARSIERAVDCRRTTLTAHIQRLTEEEELERIRWIQNAIRCTFARKAVQRANEFWSNVRGNIPKLGPGHPKERNFVISLGVPINMRYQGYAVTVDLEDGNIETRIVSRYTEDREVSVRVAFSCKPLIGGRFALSPPDSMIGLHSLFLEAFIIQRNNAGRDVTAISPLHLRRALQAVGLVMTDDEVDDLIKKYGVVVSEGPPGTATSGAASPPRSPRRSPRKSEVRTRMDLDGYKKMMAGPEFKAKVQDAAEESAEKGDAMEGILYSLLHTIVDDEDAWDDVGGGQEEVLTPPGWFEEFLGRKPQLPPPPPIRQDPDSVRGSTRGSRRGSVGGSSGGGRSPFDLVSKLSNSVESSAEPGTAADPAAAADDGEHGQGRDGGVEGGQVSEQGKEEQGSKNIGETVISQMDQDWQDTLKVAALFGSSKPTSEAADQRQPKSFVGTFQKRSTHLGSFDEGPFTSEYPGPGRTSLTPRRSPKNDMGSPTSLRHGPSSPTARGGASPLMRKSGSASPMRQGPSSPMARQGTAKSPMLSRKGSQSPTLPHRGSVSPLRSGASSPMARGLGSSKQFEASTDELPASMRIGPESPGRTSPILRSMRKEEAAMMGSPERTTRSSSKMMAPPSMEGLYSNHDAKVAAEAEEAERLRREQAEEDGEEGEGEGEEEGQSPVITLLKMPSSKVVKKGVLMEPPSNERDGVGARGSLNGVNQGNADGAEGGGGSPLLASLAADEKPSNIRVSGGDFGGQGQGGDEEGGMGGATSEPEASMRGGEGALQRKSTVMTMMTDAGGAEGSMMKTRVSDDEGSMMKRRVSDDEGSMMKRRISAMSEGSQGHSVRGRRASKILSEEELPGYNINANAAGRGTPKAEPKKLSLMPPPSPFSPTEKGGSSIFQKLKDSGKSFRDAIKASVGDVAPSKLANLLTGGSSRRTGGRGFSISEDVDAEENNIENKRRRRRQSLALLEGESSRLVFERAKSHKVADNIEPVNCEVFWPYFGAMAAFEGNLVRTVPPQADDDLMNSDDVFEKVALCASGTCTLPMKARNAQNAGAIALIIQVTEEEMALELEVYKLTMRERETEFEADRKKAAQEREREIEAEIAKASMSQKPGMGLFSSMTTMSIGQKGDKKDKFDLAAWENENDVPEYERRSAVRIPVVLIQETQAWILAKGCLVKVPVYDANVPVTTSAWPYADLTKAMCDKSVRDDWVCMSNIYLRAFHAVCLTQLPIGAHPDDPDSWSVETLRQALAAMDWKPKPHKEYSQHDLALLAKNMKCLKPGKQDLSIYKVHVDEAQHLPMLDIGVLACSQVSLVLNSVERKTRVVRESQDPLWEETFKFQVNDNDTRRSLLYKARETFLECCRFDELRGVQTEEVDIEGLMKLCQELKLREDPQKLLARFDVNKLGLIDWPSFVLMFDEMGLDVRDLLVTLTDNAIGGLPTVVGTAKVSVKGIRSGEIRTINLKLKDGDGEALYGHDNRATIIRIRISRHEISSNLVFEDPEKEAVRLLAGSDKLLEHLECCTHLGPPHKVQLALTTFDTSIPENPWREFRVFVFESRVTGICQRSSDLWLSELCNTETVERFKMLILNFFYHDVCHEMEEEAYQDYILDVYITPPGKGLEPEVCKLVSVKPFDESVDGCMFDWSDPVDKMILFDGEIMPTGTPQYIPLDDEQIVPNVMLRIRDAPFYDPLRTLPHLWEVSLKDILTDSGLEDPNSKSAEIHAHRLNTADRLGTAGSADSNRGLTAKSNKEDPTAQGSVVCCIS